MSFFLRVLRKIFGFIYPFHAYSFSADGKAFRFRERRLIWGVLLVAGGLLFVRDIQSGSDRVAAPTYIAWPVALILLVMGLRLLIQDRVLLNAHAGTFHFGVSFLGTPLSGRKGRLEDIDRIELVYDLFRSTADGGDSYCYRYLLHQRQGDPLRFAIYNIGREEASLIAQGISDLIGCPWEYREFIR